MAFSPGFTKLEEESGPCVSRKGQTYAQPT
jgi:hypothetical protein